MRRAALLLCAVFPFAADGVATADSTTVGSVVEAASDSTKPILLPTVVVSEHRPGRLGGDFGEGLEGDLLEGGDPLRRMADVRGLVPLAPVGGRREVGAVRLHDEPVDGAEGLVPLQAWRAELAGVTGLFYGRGRIYYTLAGSRALHYRYFNQESGIVGAQRLVASRRVGGFAPRRVQGLFVAGRHLYWITGSGRLRRTGWHQSAQAGEPSGEVRRLRGRWGAGVVFAGPAADPGSRRGLRRCHRATRLPRTSPHYPRRNEPGPVLCWPRGRATGRASKRRCWS